MSVHAQSKAKESLAVNQSTNSARKYKPGSLFEHLSYGVVTMILLVAPLVFTGISIKEWFIVLSGFVVIIYIIICIIGAWDSVRRGVRKKSRF